MLGNIVLMTKQEGDLLSVELYLVHQNFLVDYSY